MTTESSAHDAATSQELEVLTPEEQAELTEAEYEAEPVAYSGTDFDVEGLVRRLDRGDIVIPSFGHGDPTLEVAGFQRGFVWRKWQMDRFIESLLLGYPIPGIMLVRQVDKRYLVLDGQQRLRTLSAFYGGVYQGREFELDNVAYKFRGLTYRSLSTEQKRQIDNTFIQATIVKTDGTPESLESVYQIFERLNSGGTQLTTHEIRIVLYSGPFVDLLVELNDLPQWRAIYGAKSPRLRDQEIILRIIALYFNSNHYFRPLKRFLNEFVGSHRDTRSLPVKEVRSLFASASDVILAGPGRSALRYRSPQVNAALTEALFVGLIRRLEKGGVIELDRVGDVINALVSRPEMANSISGSTATEDHMKTRLALATEAFAKL